MRLGKNGLLLSVLTFLAVAPAAGAREFWTIEIGMAGTTAFGTSAVSIKGTPTGGNPAGPWVSCAGNWLYLHEYYPHAEATERVPVTGERLQNLLSVATVAWVGNYKVRVSLDRDSAGKCYVSSFYLTH